MSVTLTFTHTCGHIFMFSFLRLFRTSLYYKFTIIPNIVVVLVMYMYSIRTSTLVYFVWNLLLTPGTVVVKAHNTPGQPVPLPAWCYDPPGNDCRWYRECLTARFSCEATADSYALGFGERLCEKFTAEMREFSPLGRAWVSTARACLQRQLVPLLNKPMSCPDRKTAAFGTHTACYTDAPYGGYTFCELPFTDWLRVAWVVKDTLITETYKSLAQAGNIVNGCVSNLVSTLFR